MRRSALLLGILLVGGLGYNLYHWFDGLTQNRIGYVFFRFPKDEGAAFQWFQRSAEKGNPKGMMNLGHCYLCGHGTEKDYKQARLWLSRSSHPKAQKLLKELNRIFSEEFVFTREIPPGIKSTHLEGPNRVEVQILNGTGRYLDFRWIDWNGNLELLRSKADWGHVSIAPGNRWGQVTYVGHPFAVVDPLRPELLGCLVFRKTGDYRLRLQESEGTLELVRE